MEDGPSGHPAGMLRDPDLPVLPVRGDGDGAGEELVRILVLVNRHVQRAVEAARREGRLSVTAIRLLFEIAKRPGMTLAQLAAVGEMSKARTSVLVESLRAEGYVDKRADAADRRLVRVFTTDKMSEVWLWYENHYLAAVNELLAPVPEPERAALVRTLRRIRAAAAGKDW
jgi:DNA-binding MarR family transcriptional regulator